MEAGTCAMGAWPRGFGEELAELSWPCSLLGQQWRKTPYLLTVQELGRGRLAKRGSPWSVGKQAVAACTGKFEARPLSVMISDSQRCWGTATSHSV